MRSGAGSVTLGVPKSITNAMIKIKPKEVMLLPLNETKDGSLSLAAFKKINEYAKAANVIVIGPGLTREKSTQILVRSVYSKIKKPMVVDADALNALAGHFKHKGTWQAIFTPHPGEMSRLTGVSINRIQANRKKAALEFAKSRKVVLVLKGHNTVVAEPGGKTYINSTGNAGMATAGSGDVLTGMIAAFLAQGLNAFESAKYAVYLHGLAGDIAAKKKTQIGLIASDIIENIPGAIKMSSS
jgi:NAD(P)H-hydrate epimerase